MIEGWKVSITRMSEEYTLEQWKEARKGGYLLGYLDDTGGFARLTSGELEVLFPERARAAIEKLPEDRRGSAREALKSRLSDARRNSAQAKVGAGVRIVGLVPPRTEAEAVANGDQKDDPPHPVGPIP